MAGKTNKDLVKLIIKSGNAVGISGVDNQLIIASMSQKMICICWRC
ncbi:MAG: hypothetical protein ACLTMR_00075 [Faecalibacillus sp.]